MIYCDKLCEIMLIYSREEGYIIDMEIKDNTTIDMRNKLNQLKHKDLKELNEKN